MSSMYITLRCRNVGLEKKIEILHSTYDAPTPVPQKGAILTYKDEQDPRFDGTYIVKKVYGDMSVRESGTGSLKYTLELKKMRKLFQKILS